MKKLLLIVSCISVLISCGNDETIENARSGTYVADRVEFFNVKMYTINGEVTSQETIADYIEKESFIEEDLFNLTSSVTNATDDFTINFVSQDVVNIDAEDENRDVREVEEYLYLEARDTVIYVKNNNELLANIGALSPLYDFNFGEIATAQNGICFSERKNCFYVKSVEEDEIEMPVMSYYLFFNYIAPVSDAMFSSNISLPFGSFSKVSIQSNNKFNEEVLQLLQPNDTLLVQEGNLILKRE